MADQIRPTPQSPILGSLASALRRAQEFTGQYQIDPRIPLLGGTSVDEMLSLPGAASLVEDMSYNGPRALIRGGNAATGGIGTFKLDPRILDLAEVGANVAPLGQLAGKAGKAGARYAGEQLNRAILDNSGPLAKLVPQAAKPMYAVKPKGGNWSPAYGAKDVVEESIQPMKRDAFIDVPELQDPKNAAMNKWLDTKLQKYIRNNMGTPDDPIRLAHEEGYSHFPGNPAGDYGSWLPEDTASMRRKAGYPEEGFAVKKLADAGYPENMQANTRKAELWENLADSEIKSRPAAAYQNQRGSFEDRILKEQADKNPWIKKLDSETPIYTLSIPSEINSTLGFGHMTDELRNMLDSTSGLPANLRLTPKQLDDVTVKQMVERVDKVNKWRAKEAAKAELAGMSDNLTATPRLQIPDVQLSFVEKPGMTWVDIPSTTDDAAKKYCTTIGRQAGWCTQGDDLAKSYGSGDNRLATLLDAEGRPHAQAMISKAKSIDQAYNDLIRGDVDITDLPEIFTPRQQKSLNKFLESDGFDGEFTTALYWIEDNFPEAHKKLLSKKEVAPEDIAELKPVGNTFNSGQASEYAKRDPQYQAKITDSVLKFLNAGEWGKVKNLDIYGVVDLQDAGSVQSGMLDVLDQVPPRDRPALFNQAVDLNPEANRFMSRSQFREFVDPDFNKQQGFAKGGSVSVYDSNKIDEIINGIDEPQGFAEGGPVHMRKGGIIKKMAKYAGDYIKPKETLIIKEGDKWVNATPREAALDIAGKANKIEKEGAAYKASLPADVREALNQNFLKPVNSLLRSSNRARAEALDEAFRNAPELPKNTQLYRGANKKSTMQSMADEFESYPFYIPTSLDMSIAKRFKDVAEDAGDLSLILPTSNTQYLLPGKFESEFEVLLPRSGEVRRANVVAPKDVDSVYLYDSRNYAKGGSVTTYDPDQVDAIANQYM